MPLTTANVDSEPGPSARRVCSGCGKDFSISGYTQHLLQTRRPLCIAVREEELFADVDLNQADGSGDDRSPPPTNAQSNGSAIDDDLPPGEPQPFEGDFFGTYEPQEFEDFDEYNGGEPAPGDDAEDGEDGEDREDGGAGGVDEDGEDGLDDDADVFEEENTWEPAPRPTHANATPEATEDNDLESDDCHRREAQERAGQQLRAKTFVVRFPGPHAGSPINQSRVRSSYEVYEAAVDASGTNPYAPFASRLDWEVAKWAKMRGPGSTALTELLNIQDLVSLLSLSFKTSQELNNIID
ncbi:hypothetical protein C8Q76DRAFT_802383 [Earliella scabrosa]|nr:hypothetical protein C8Q76DRAFT_802383 [Earliella scabrosa]